MVKTGRGKSPTRMTAVTKYVMTIVKPLVSVLDFGAGIQACQTRILRDWKAPKTVCFDVPENMVEGLHDPHALRRRYDLVMASNVLNVQGTLGDLRRTLGQLALVTGQYMVCNYPGSPRFMPSLTLAKFRKELDRWFDEVYRVPGQSTPIFRCAEPRS